MVTSTLDPDRKVALNLRDIPADLRNRFKSYCSRNELTMTGAIVNFMESRVAEWAEKEKAQKT